MLRCSKKYSVTSLFKQNPDPYEKSQRGKCHNHHWADGWTMTGLDVYLFVYPPLKTRQTISSEEVSKPSVTVVKVYDLKIRQIFQWKFSRKIGFLLTCISCKIINSHFYKKKKNCLNYGTVCVGSSDPPEKIFNIFVSENEVNTFINYYDILGWIFNWIK